MAIFITKMKRLWHHIIFITGILMLVKRNLFIETDPSCPPIPSQCDECENQASVAEIYGHWIFKWVSVSSLHTMHQDSSPVNDQKDYMLNLDSSRPSMSAVFIIRSVIYIYICPSIMFSIMSKINTLSSSLSLRLFVLIRPFVCNAVGTNRSLV